MSADKPGARTPRMQITVDPTPAPPWTGVKFTCEKCQAEYHLEAADRCVPIMRGSGKVTGYLTPICLDCGHVNVVEIDGHRPPLQEEEAQFPS